MWEPKFIMIWVLHPSFFKTSLNCNFLKVPGISARQRNSVPWRNDIKWPLSHPIPKILLVVKFKTHYLLLSSAPIKTSPLLIGLKTKFNWYFVNFNYRVCSWVWTALSTNLWKQKFEKFFNGKPYCFHLTGISIRSIVHHKNFQRQIYHFLLAVHIFCPPPQLFYTDSVMFWIIIKEYSIVVMDAIKGGGGEGVWSMWKGNASITCVTAQKWK